MMMKCHTYAGRLAAFLDGELPAREARALAEHLKGCPACSRTLAELQEAGRLLAAWQETPTPSADFDRTFWQKVTVLRDQQRTHQTRGVRAWLSGLLSTRSASLAASAACAICILVASLFVLQSKRGVPDGSIALARDFELYANLEVIENSEALEYFDVIAVLDTLEKDRHG